MNIPPPFAPITKDTYDYYKGPHNHCTTHHEHSHVIINFCDFLKLLKIDCSYLLETPICVDPTTGYHYIMDVDPSGHMTKTTQRTIF